MGDIIFLFIRTRSECKTQRSNTNLKWLIAMNFVIGHFEGDNGPVLYGNVSGSLCQLISQVNRDL